MAKDPAKMSLKELQELELKVKRAKLTVKERSRSELRQKLESIAAQAGFKLSDLFGGRGGKGRKVAASQSGRSLADLERARPQAALACRQS